MSFYYGVFLAPPAVPHPVLYYASPPCGSIALSSAARLTAFAFDAIRECALDTVFEIISLIRHALVPSIPVEYQPHPAEPNSCFRPENHPERVLRCTASRVVKLGTREEMVRGWFPYPLFLSLLTDGRGNTDFHNLLFVHICRIPGSIKNYLNTIYLMSADFAEYSRSGPIIILVSTRISRATKYV